jgi:hypothetical protein
MPLRLGSDSPFYPETAPVPPLVAFEDMPQFGDSPFGQLSLVAYPADFALDPSPGSVPTRPTVTRYDGALPDIVTRPWHPTDFWAELGLSADQTARVELVLNAPDSVEEERMVARAASLDATGLPLDKQNRVSFKITKPHIRYYNNADAPLAQALADKFDVELRDFSRNGADNGPNRIEFWMAGETDRKPVTKQRVAKKKRAAPPRRKTVRRVDPKQALRQRLARKLRQGDHL